MNRLTEHFFETSKGIFTQSDVAVAIDGSHFSRHGLVKRAMAGGEILNIRRGLYCLAPKYMKNPISVYCLAQYAHGPSYVSLESALSYHGWIPEAVYACTCVSYRSGREFETPLGVLSYKRVPQNIFYVGVERRVDKNGNVFLMASPAKALADYVYVRRLSWTGIDDVATSLRIEPHDLTAIRPQELSDLAENYTNGRVKRFLAGWEETLES